eukprot:5586645-Prymnesium_polylepis.1
MATTQSHLNFHRAYAHGLIYVSLLEMEPTENTKEREQQKNASEVFQFQRLEYLIICKTNISPAPA